MATSPEQFREWLDIYGFFVVSMNVTDTTISVMAADYFRRDGRFFIDRVFACVNPTTRPKLVREDELIFNRDQWMGNKLTWEWVPCRVTKYVRELYDGDP